MSATTPAPPDGSNPAIVSATGGISISTLFVKLVKVFPRITKAFGSPSNGAQVLDVMHLSREVGSVVDDDARRAPARDCRRASGEFVKYSRAQILLAQLDECDARGDGTSDEREQRGELSALARRLASRLAARDETSYRPVE